MFLYVDPYTKTGYKSPTPVSEAMFQFSYADKREFVQPYEKRCYLTDKTDLSTNGYAKWITDRIDLIAGEKWKDAINFSGKITKVLSLCRILTLLVQTYIFQRLCTREWGVLFTTPLENKVFNEKIAFSQ